MDWCFKIAAQNDIKIMVLIKRLQDIRLKDVADTGGKSAVLGELIKAGFEIPVGFVVLSSAFDSFIVENRVDLNEAKSKPKDVFNKIIGGSLSEELINKLVEETEILESERFAVRSSALSEDSKQLSWAGQLETFLNIERRQLSEKIKECWASQFTTRAINYRIDNIIQESAFSMGVIVQKMILPDKAGIAFTIDPVNGENNIIIEAALGLGDKVVSGEVTPDNYKFIKSNGNLEMVKVNQNVPVLNEGEIRQIVEKAIVIEKILGYASDIEWAIKNDTIYILQARPITTI